MRCCWPTPCFLVDGELSFGTGYFESNSLRFLRFVLTPIVFAIFVSLMSDEFLDDWTLKQMP
jgi:hypothetical protein